MSEVKFYLLLLVVLTVLALTLMACNWWLDGKTGDTSEEN